MTDQIDPGGLIIAAGGIVEKQTEQGPLVAVIHRHLYGDEWSLPKGKQEPGETIQETASREVHEETGCRVRFLKFVGVNHYYHGEMPKIVLYWHMEFVEDTGFAASPEVSDLEWLPPGEALKKLAYADERDMLGRLYNLSEDA